MAEDSCGQSYEYITTGGGIEVATNACEYYWNDGLADSRIFYVLCTPKAGGSTDKKELTVHTGVYSYNYGSEQKNYNGYDTYNDVCYLYNATTKEMMTEKLPGNDATVQANRGDTMYFYIPKDGILKAKYATLDNVTAQIDGTDYELAVKYDGEYQVTTFDTYNMYRYSFTMPDSFNYSTVDVYFNFRNCAGSDDTLFITYTGSWMTGQMNSTFESPLKMYMKLIDVDSAHANGDSAVWKYAGATQTYATVPN